MNILLNFFFPIVANSPTPAASTAFLKQVCAVVAPKMGVTPGVLVTCTTSSQIAAVTDNVEALQLLSAGMSKVILLPMDDLDLAEALDGHESDFYTLLISSDFDDADILETKASGNITITSYANLVSGTPDSVSVAGVLFTAQAGAATLGTATFQAATSNNATAASLAAQINAHAVAKLLVTATPSSAIVAIEAKNAGSSGNAIALAYTDNDTNVGATKSGTLLTGGDGLFLGTFDGVVGVASDDDDFLADQAVIENRCAFHIDDSNGSKNMFFAFGKLLSNPLDWLNQQYITMPLADDVDTVGYAETLFDDKISFVINDDEFGKRLSLFAAGGKAIVAPYIDRNLEIDMQSKALQFVTANQPQYTRVEATLLEDELQKVIDSYIVREWISSGKAQVDLQETNFVASASIEISEPTALWRIFGEVSQTN